MKSQNILKLILFSVVIIIAISLTTGCTPDIGSLKDKGDVKGLIKALEYDGSESGVVFAAQEALVEIGSEAVIPLCHALNHKNPYVSMLAAGLLGEIGDKAAATSLIEAIDDKDIGYTAIRSLGFIGDTQAIEPLMQKLKDLKSSDKELHEYENIIAALTMINIKYMTSLFEGDSVIVSSYAPDKPGPHPIIVADNSMDRFDVSFKENKNSFIPIDWRSLGYPEKIELVLYCEIEEIGIEVCNYGSGGIIERIRQDLNVELKEAATGKSVANAIIEGENPSKCPGYRTEGYDDIKSYGELPAEALIEWLRPFVE